MRKNTIHQLTNPMIIIAFAFAVSVMYLFVTSQLHFYISPKLHFLQLLTSVVLVFIGLVFMFTKKFSFRKKDTMNCFIFCLPLLFIIFFPVGDIDVRLDGIMNVGETNIIYASGDNQNQENTINEIKIVEETQNILENSQKEIQKNISDTEKNTQNKNNLAQINITNNKIIVDDSNFYKTVSEIINNPKKYEGLDIEITGMTAKPLDILKQNRFLLGRIYMWHCFADASPVVLLFESDDVNNIANDAWYTITARIQIEGDEDKFPVLVVKNYVAIEGPDHPFVYG